MDEQRFDDLVKRAASTSRRQVLGSLLGGLSAAVSLLGGGRGWSSAVAQGDNCGVCNEVSPSKERGNCRSSCARSGGFPAGCTSVAQLCRSASGTYTCCVGGPTCVSGACSGCTTTCSAPKTQLNPSTCACECPPCATAGQVPDPSTCVCGGGCEACGPNQIQDLVTCGCACDLTTTCPVGEMFDPAACRCVCDPLTTSRPGSCFRGCVCSTTPNNPGCPGTPCTFDTACCGRCVNGQCQAI